MIDERTEQALSMYALGCIDDEDLEYLIGRDSSSFTDEERKYVDDLSEDYDNYIQQQLNKHNDAESND